MTTPQSPVLPPQDTIVMYSTTWCGYCTRLKSQLTSAQISFIEVNVEEVPGTAEYVELVNGGNRVVPTVVFPDGSSVTNPSLKDAQRKLSQSVNE